MGSEVMVLKRAVNTVITAFLGEDFNPYGHPDN